MFYITYFQMKYQSLYTSYMFLGHSQMQIKCRVSVVYSNLELTISQHYSIKWNSSLNQEGFSFQKHWSTFLVVVGQKELNCGKLFLDNFIWMKFTPLEKHTLAVSKINKKVDWLLPPALFFFFFFFMLL